MLFIRGDKRYFVYKNGRGLYDYEMEEWSEINKKWVKVSYGKDYTKEALESYLGINI